MADPNEPISITVNGSTHTRTAAEWLALSRAALRQPMAPSEPEHWAKLRALGWYATDCRVCGTSWGALAMPADGVKTPEPYCACEPTKCHGEGVQRCRWRLMGYSPTDGVRDTDGGGHG
jgi:hypothetical protein